jgi:integrase
VKFPKVIRHRKAEAKIYGKSKRYPFYRVAHYAADGKRRIRSFATYSAALSEAERTVRDLSQGNQSAALTAKHASDALAALELLQGLHQSTGRRVSLRSAVAEFVEAAGRLRGRTLGEAVDGYLNSVASVKRVDVGQAMEQFIKSRAAKTVATNGKRPQLSPEHFTNTAYWLREFAGTFPGHAVCDLSKEHLNLYMAGHAKAAPKTRNERRGVVKMFLQWCVAQDYLAPTHRLFEASDLKNETADPEEIDYYRPSELRALLENADTKLRPVLALAGLAGLREKEILRLTWEDVFGVPGHVEVKGFKSKTRSRRLVAVCPALAAWLNPYRSRTGLLWARTYGAFHETVQALRAGLKIPLRRNGLRHSFITYHFALHANENLTAAQAGNSPAMIHHHYKGLATNKEAAAWFAVRPAKTENNIIALPQKGIVS